MNSDTGELWDRYRAARERDATLTPERFSRELAEQEGADASETLDLLILGENLEDLRPAVPLVDLADGDGTHFAGFRLVRELGRGAFGIVYEAVLEGESCEDAEPVALKVLNPLAIADASRQRDLLREAAVGERLDHPGIVRVLASGVERGYAWFASQQIRGIALDRLPAASDPHARALDLGLQLAEAVAHAHERGVVHRDLKPANVLVTDEGRVKVLDFGLAHADRIGASIRVSGEVVGTPLFMAPEQLAGRSVGPWSDVWALGLLLAELAAPGTVRRLASSSQISIRLGRRDRSLSRRQLHGLPADLREVVARCLEPVAADRYRSARELAEDLAALASGSARPHGRPDAALRLVRHVRRHPIAASARALLVFLPALVAYELWWMASVAVRIETFDEGKSLSVDGRPVGVAPITLLLRPGRHRWEVTTSGPSNPGARYTGSFEVEPRVPRQHVQLALDWAGRIPTVRPGTGDDYLHGEYAAIPPGAGAWLVVAVRPEDADVPTDRTAGTLRVEGLPTGPVELPVVFRTRVPFGSHRLELSAPGHSPRALELDVTEDRLHFVAEALDALGPDGRPAMRTTVLYAYLDERTRRLLAAGETRNLRPYLEHQAFDGGQQVTKPYLGLADWRRPGLARLTLPLSPPDGRVLVDVRIQATAGGGQNLTDGGWLRISAGAPDGPLVPLANFDAEEPGAADEAWSALPATLDPDAALPKLTGAVAAGRLALAFDVGPAPAGEGISYTSALRSEALPREDEDVPGTFYWFPAIVVRTRLD